MTEELSPEDTAANGYTNVRLIHNQGLCGLLRFNFTWGLVVGLNASGYTKRYCYENRADALDALEAWDGSDHPDGPWIKLKGMGLDLLNPKIDSKF